LLHIKKNTDYPPPIFLAATSSPDVPTPLPHFSVLHCGHDVDYVLAFSVCKSGSKKRNIQHRKRSGADGRRQTITHLLFIHSLTRTKYCFSVTLRMWHKLKMFVQYYVVKAKNAALCTGYYVETLL